MFSGIGLYKLLYDKRIISDLRIKDEDEEKIIFGVKRSKYKIKIPKAVTPEIAYLAGVIAGDGSFYYSNLKNRVFPGVKIVITSDSQKYLKLINKIVIHSFDAGGQIRKEIKKKRCYDLFINHRVIWLYFRKVLELDKRKLKISKEIANKELFRFFLAGFFDTDGYISRDVFGTMIGGKNALFLNQLVRYSKKFYGLEFSPVKINTLRVKEKEFKRAYTRLRRKDTEQFISLVPLINEKYTWACAGSNRGSSLFSLRTP